ncbi:hypothetical protein NM688_g3460 [Phlebia brevispora]|uniref:Uncharacterized protein n=1 Tax=Phlebia brevispora TaxID=194682 RepID=A0ACC1T637_9APHY|nr:hypothetical protein NM688_g3460 [Phlebia brevispora]
MRAHLRYPLWVHEAACLYGFHSCLAQAVDQRHLDFRRYHAFLTSRPSQRVAFITLDRPKALNTLPSPLILELNEALANFGADDEAGAVVVIGGEGAFTGVQRMPPSPTADTKLLCTRSTSKHKGDEGQDLLGGVQAQVSRELVARDFSQQASRRGREQICG